MKSNVECDMHDKDRILEWFFSFHSTICTLQSEFCAAFFWSRTEVTSLLAVYDYRIDRQQCLQVNKINNSIQLNAGDWLLPRTKKAWLTNCKV
jgi:hypothetical protein